MIDLVYRILGPVRGVLKRWAPTRLKQIVWHAEFKRGKHLHDIPNHGKSEVCYYIEKYAEGGDVLDLGCADGHVGFGLDPEKCRSYTGVDISEVGVKQAKCQRDSTSNPLPQMEFVVGDISKYIPSKPVDVILFKDSLYYIPKRKIIPVLHNLRKYLKSNGVFIVQMDNIKRHNWIRNLILANFDCLEDRVYRDRDFMRLIFR